MSQISTIILQLAVFAIALSIHEFSHAAVARLLGDETAERQGRLTLNPLAHIDPIGTVVLPLVGAIFGVPVIGWAKPTPYNPHNLRYQRWGPLMVALAGPVSNFLTALAGGFVLKAVLVWGGLTGDNLLVIVLLTLVLESILLGVFNLLPIPPLDGSAILRAIFAAPKYDRFFLSLQRYGFLLIYLLIIADSFGSISFLGMLFRTVTNGFLRVMGLV